MPILDQLLVNNFTISSSGYTGSRGNVGYAGSNGSNGSTGYTGSAGTSGTSSTSPKITAIAYPGNDTAADIAGSQTITLTGTNFVTGASVFVDTVQASIVSVVNSTTITFTAPAMSTGSYIVYVINPDSGIGLLVPGIQYSGTPTWTTAAGSLGTVFKQTSFTANLTATGDAPITYSVYSGTLPSGITLTANTGVISGTAPNVASDTTYNFTIRATDAQLQDTDRAFGITVSSAVAPTTVEYLVVAGGGSGGTPDGGGGGAGGYQTATGYAVTAGSPITITVGAGGTAVSAVPSSAPTYGNNGSNSVFGTITSIGGGGGGAYLNGAGLSGGAGGGGGNLNKAGGTGTSGQGNNGGPNSGSSPSYGGGGGGGGNTGSGGIGGTGGSGGGGVGGQGLASSISGTSTYYAGGGGGGADNTAGAGAGGNGGLGGGGKGGYGVSSYTAAVSGTPNTGGGGGGAGWNPGVSTASGSGGSGIVIIRYADTYSAATSTTGSPTVTVGGGYRVYKFTSSGSITF